MSILKKLGIALIVIVLVLLVAGWWVMRGSPAQYSVEEVTGDDPVLAEPDPQLVPTVKVARPIGWEEGQSPKAAAGLAVNRFAEGLDHPRVIYTMPNGDVIAALANAPERELAGGWLTNLVAGFLFREAGAATPSADALVLLRDGDGDGVAEEKHVLREGLASPSGLGFADGKLYVANHDALISFDYEEGATSIAGEPRKLMDLPPAGNHWMRNLIISPDNSTIYVAVGSASNIGEGGLEIEEGRAAIHEYDIASGTHRLFGAGLRNPNGLDWNPWTGELWTTVNERDMLGSDLVPDYMTNVPVGAQYGWPWFYWGDVMDERVDHPMPNYLVEYTRRPEMALGPHVAALGLVFSREGSMMGPAFANGAFVARHGSWNRKPPAGYDLVFVKFDERGNPTGKPVPVLESFLTPEGQTHGRPTWLTWDRTGALLLSDDTAGIIWRITAPGAEPHPAIERNSGESLPPQRELRGDPSRAFENPPADLQPGAI